MVKHHKNWSHIKFLWTFLNLPYLFLALQLLAYTFTLIVVQFIKNCNRIMNFWVFILAKLTSFYLTFFLWKKLQNRKNCVLTKNTFCSIFPVLINLQKCTIPHFKGNFIIKDLFLYHGWAVVVSGAARDENVSLLTFGTPSRYMFSGTWQLCTIFHRQRVHLCGIRKYVDESN